MTQTTQQCGQAGCAGAIEDDYCNVCGSPAGAPSTARSGAGVSPTEALGTGIASASAGPSSSGDESAADQSSRTARTSSSRLASTAIGSARTSGAATSATRRIGTGSARLRRARLGAGLTTVPTATVADPMSVVMAEPEVPEAKRFCPACGGSVGRARGDQPGRTTGFCPACGSQFTFDPQLAPGDLVGGQYEVVGCMAHGGMGWIYLARDRNVSGRWVVLKGLLNAGDPDAYAAAISERQFLAEVEHPLIVEIYNFVMHEGAGFTVMEYVGGPSLKSILKDRMTANDGTVDPLPVDQALAYVLEIMPAFQYLHDMGLIFCDFKPDNMIQSGDSVKLIDLGGVRRTDDLTSAIFGTVGYQAPEVPDVGTSVASDIYTIGRTLATLVLDFRGNQTTYVASLPPVADTPVFGTYDSFYRLLAKACAPEPADRFASVDEMRAQLLGVLREVVAADRGPGNPALHSASSVLFEPPTADVVDQALPWDALPQLKVDDSDPMASWLAGVNVADPEGRHRALAEAPEDTVEVRLARARAAIEAGTFDLAAELVAQMLDHDPWEWRAVWTDGLAKLAQNDPAGARAAMNAVYGQIPGELAPKLALAAACEASGETAIAEALYVICARSDANYTAPAAFGLSRVRIAAGDIDGALHALDLVAPTRGSFIDARRRKATLLVRFGDGLPALSDALAAVDAVSLAARERADLTTQVLRSALAEVTTSGANPDLALGRVRADGLSIRTALEGELRTLAHLTDDAEQRRRLVDEANTVRPWTLT